jgi:hypothetical protein
VPGRFDAKTNRCKACGAGAHWRAGSCRDSLTNQTSPRQFEPFEEDASGTFWEGLGQLPVEEARRRQRLWHRLRAIRAAYRLQHRPQPPVEPDQEFETLMIGDHTGYGLRKTSRVNRDGAPDVTWDEMRAYHGMPEGSFSIEGDARITGAPPPGRPKSGQDVDLASELLAAQELLMPYWPLISRVAGLRQLSPKKRRRVVQSLLLSAQLMGGNIDALVEVLGENSGKTPSRATIYRLRPEGTKLLQEVGMELLAQTIIEANAASEARIIEAAKANTRQVIDALATVLCDCNGEAPSEAAERLLRETED